MNHIYGERIMRKSEERVEMDSTAAVVEEEGEEVEIPMIRALPTEMNKRKLHGEELSGCSSSLLQVKRCRRIVVTDENSDELCSSSSSDHVLSCPSSIELAEEKSVTKDLKEEDDEASSVEISISPTYNTNKRVRKETTPLSELQPVSAETDSTTTMRSSEVNTRRRSSKMPSEAELEEFFSAAEGKLQKQFADKYNFDIVNDEPLEGRYEWVKVKP